MIVDVTNKNGIILKTSGKYCAEDILVKPSLQKRVISENGEYSSEEGYCGHGDLIVNVVPKLQKKTITMNDNGSVKVFADPDQEGLKEVEVIVDVQIHDIYANGEEVEF